jgi:hypothetical protein
LVWIANLNASGKIKPNRLKIWSRLSLEVRLLD